MPTVTGDVINYPAKGYRARIPSGWNFQPNAVRAEEFAPDYLIRPETVDGVQANIIITCEQLVGEARQLTLDQFVENKTTRAIRLGATDDAERPATTVGGAPVRVLQYSRVLNNTPIVRRDMLFLHDDCAWQFAYTVSPGLADSLQSDVDAFASSFEFIDRNGQGAPGASRHR